MDAAVESALSKLLMRPVDSQSLLWPDLRINADILYEIVEAIRGAVGVDMYDFDWMKYVPPGWAVGPGEFMWTKLFGGKVRPLTIGELCDRIYQKYVQESV